MNSIFATFLAATLLPAILLGVAALRNSEPKPLRRPVRVREMVRTPRRPGGDII